MKVNRNVSLDIETARIADQMANFSRFVRVAVHAHAMGDGIEHEQRLRRTWKRVSDHLLDVIRHETNWDDEQMQEVLLNAMASARNQEEFDV